MTQGPKCQDKSCITSECDGKPFEGFWGEWHDLIYVLKGSLLLLCAELTGKGKREAMGLVRSLTQPSRQERTVARTRLTVMETARSGWISGTYFESWCLYMTVIQHRTRGAKIEYTRLWELRWKLHLAVEWAGTWAVSSRMSGQKWWGRRGHSKERESLRVKAPKRENRRQNYQE